MKQSLIRYKTKLERTDDNERLIKDVFAELHAKSPEGVRYMAVKLGDGTFIHLVETKDDSNPITTLDAFVLSRTASRSAASSRRNQAT